MNLQRRNTLMNVAGVIVFSQYGKVALVKTPAGNWGFPKGKREGHETLLGNALRELYEETGLMASDIQVLNGQYLDEYSKKGNLSVRYFIARALHEKPLKAYDTHELAEAVWLRVEDALKLDRLKDRRKDLLTQAYERVRL